MSTPTRAAALLGGTALALALASPAAADYGQVTTGHEATAECGQVTLTFTNPTAHPYSGDYRVGDQPGQADEHSEIIAKEGPWEGEPLGDRYNPVAIPAGETVTVVVETTEDTTVEYWVNRGPEQNAWAAVQSVDVTACEDQGDEGEGGEDGEGEGDTGEGDTGEGGDETPGLATVTFTDTCDGISGELTIGDDKGKYRYSTWLEDTPADEAVRITAGDVLVWEPVQAEQVRVLVEHKPKGKHTEWETVLDQTHTHTAPQDCEDTGEGDLTEEEQTTKPVPDDKPSKGTDPVKSDAGGSLPVTGGALVGLVAAAVAALGAGGGALYLARKRKANTGE